VALTNFCGARQAFGDVASALITRIGVLEICQSPDAHRRADDDGGPGDFGFTRGLICFTNGFSTADPGPVTPRHWAKKRARQVETVSFSATADGAG